MRGFVLADVPHRVTWRALWAYVQHADRESALCRVVGGEKATWGTVEHLLAVLVDMAQVELWAKTKDGRRNMNRPKPVRRPGQEPDETRYGDASMDLDETKAWLESRLASASPMQLEKVVT